MTVLLGAAPLAANRVLYTEEGRDRCENVGEATLAVVDRHTPLLAMVPNPTSCRPTRSVDELPGRNRTSVPAGKKPETPFDCGSPPFTLLKVGVVPVPLVVR